MTATARRLALLLACVAAAGCAGRAGMPDWAVRGFSDRYPADRYLIGVGAAPVQNGDRGAALEAAEARARSQIARVLVSEVRGRSEAVAQEWRAWGGDAAEGRGVEALYDQSTVATRAELKQARRVAQHVDTRNRTAHALVVVDLDALARAVQSELGRYDAVKLALARARDDTRALGRRIEDLAATLAAWPGPPESLAFLATAAPQRAARLRTLIPARQEAVALLGDLVGRVELRLKPEQPPRRGEPLVIALGHNAPGLALQTSASPSVVEASPQTLAAGPAKIRLARTLPGGGGKAVVTLRARSAINWLGTQAATVGRAAFEVGGPEARLRVRVRDRDCGLDADATASLVAACAEGFVHVDDDTADRSLDVELTCRADRSEQRGYAYTLLNAVVTVRDSWRDGSVELTASGAGSDRAQAAEALAQGLAPRLCATP